MPQTPASSPLIWKPVILYIVEASAWLAVVYTINTMLVHAGDFPGLFGMLKALGMSTLDAQPPSNGLHWAVGSIQLASYALALIWPLQQNKSYGSQTLTECKERMSECASYIVAAAFFAVVLIGLVDAIISFLRVENLFVPLFGEALDQQMGRAVTRGMYVQMPLLALSFVLALMLRGQAFVWLASMVVLSELTIVVSRFVFSYEQAFMGDLVRFWYAGLFLFASAYTLLHDGHVRVDVLYARFSEQAKARTNIFGSLLLGLPLCWAILLRGLWSKSSMISSPLTNFEISQSGAGMFVKYLMAGFLLIFVLSMLFQFAGFVADYLRRFESDFEPEEAPTPVAH
ncbi:MAG: TRAP transporter small permease subunit [Alphaproteobacteria bacterium]